MIEIETLREYYRTDCIVITDHAHKRCRERDISQKDIRHCIFNGEIIEQYPDDFPWLSCLICGPSEDGMFIHVVASDNGDISKIVTAYIPDTETFSEDLKTRRNPL